jgi:ATP-dependent DNA helicase RecQ
MTPSQAEIDALLHERFGHQSFRPGQREVIRALLRGRDTLAVLPTGAGKSLAYQLTAQLLPGVTLVVTPLLALMHDQVESLRASGVGVSTISGELSDSQAAAELQQVAEGHAKLLYVTPERFENEGFAAAIHQIEVGLFVVDEAHCVAEWGHSFRPAYLRLAGAIERLGRPAVLALTATATPWIRAEITERLGLRDPVIVVRGVDRPNLFFEVRRVESEDEDRRVLRQLLAGGAGEYPPEIAPRLETAMQGSGIIYTATTRAARDTAEWLREWGITADYYHGQRTKADRARVQNGFMAGDLRVIAATNAFGLGIDKPNVRFVIHRDIPASLEAYYQEAGRAGRDGEFARCTLIYRPGDLGRAAFLAAGGQLTRDELDRAWAALQARPRATMTELRAASGLGSSDMLRAVELLKQARVVDERRGRIYLRKPAFDPTCISLADEEHRRAYERSRIDMIRGYAEGNACRRRYLLNYFGDDEDEQCSLCDVDQPRATAERVPIGEESPTQPAPFEIGERVEHTAWGAGVIQRIANGSMTVLFETAGYKTLATGTVQERGLLRSLGAAA